MMKYEIRACVMSNFIKNQKSKQNKKFATEKKISFLTVVYKNQKD